METKTFWKNGLAAVAAFFMVQGMNAADLSVGEPFPRQAFPSAGDGSPLSIAQFSGQKTALHIFASW